MSASAPELGARIRPVMPFKPDLVPVVLRREPHWVCWVLVVTEAKPDKIPINARTGEYASTKDSHTWCPFEVAARAAEANPTYAGVGYVLASVDPFTGIDLDNCIDDDGLVHPAALAIIRRFNSYTERSPSGRGVRIFIVASKPAGTGCQFSGVEGIGKVEIYDRGRFLTVTGAHIEGTPATVESCQEELTQFCNELWPRQTESRPASPRTAANVTLDDDEIFARAGNAKNGEKFRQLWRGDTSGHGGDDSRADLALCSILAFWTQKDASRIDQLFRSSGLMRQKWDECHSSDGRTYGQMTIDKAIAGCCEVYSRTQKSRRDDLLDGPCGVGLQVRRITKTPARFNVKFAVQLDGRDTGRELGATDTSRGVANAKRDLIGIIQRSRQPEALPPAQVSEVGDWLETLLTTSSLEILLRRSREQPVSVEPAAPNQQFMLDITLAHMKELLKPAFRSDRGMWSERDGCFISRHDFTQIIDPDLLDALQDAVDYAAPTEADPTKPIKHLQRLLLPVWTSMWENLPDELGAVGLGPEAKAAAAFRLRVLDLWRIPETWIKVDPAPGQPGYAERASLATRARSIQAAPRSSASPWQRLLKGVDAFYCVTIDSPPRLWLGMRAGLCRGQIKGVRLDSVIDQSSLSTLMQRYGLTASAGVSDRMREDGSQCRITVLARDVCDVILDRADERDMTPVTAPIPTDVTSPALPEDSDVECAEVAA